VDPRIARTRRTLQEALLDLARERELDTISVADIAERAGVNRSTFYQHYSDKETLLADALDAVAAEAGASLPVMTVPTETAPRALVEYLRHVESNAALYRSALGPNGSPVVIERLRDRVERLVEHHLAGAEEGMPFVGLPVDVVAAGITGSLIGVIRAWLEREPRPSAEVAADWVWRILTGAAPARSR